jgi:hypothetical protein
MNGFQASFAQALLAGEAQCGLFAQPGFAVHRNTVLKGCVDALEANFPTVCRFVGRDWFRAAALAYARAQPPQDSRLLAYGDEGFAAFLQALPTTADWPWLAGVAHADGLWRACHRANDASVLPAQALARFTPEALAARVLRLHPATRWAWFEDHPVASLWSHERAGEPVPASLAWHGEGLLLTRAAGAVQWQQLPRAGCAFLAACAAGRPLGEAAQQALADDPETALAPVLPPVLRAGAVTGDLLP